MSISLLSPVLGDAIVRLEPLGVTHLDGLRAAAAGPRDTFDYTAVPTPDTVEAMISEELERAATGTFWPFVQIDARSGAVVGHTSYLSPRWWPGQERLLGIEIGTTWLRQSAQSTAINPAAKRLLLAHAFLEWGVSRVDIKTDARNARARASILATGARFEGVLRSWQPSGVPGEEGLPRDTAMYSIIAAEWPEVEAHLAGRIAARLDAES